MTTVDLVRGYLEREWWIIALHPRSKRPIEVAWSTTRPDPSDVIEVFEQVIPTPNVGMVMGDLKVDVDLDCAESVALAPYFLPRTEAIWGHREKPRSHWLYLLSEPLGADQRKPRRDPVDARILVETRTNDHQSMMPGSIHPNGYPVEWSGRPGHWDPATIAPDEITVAVDRLFAASLLARHWGDPGSGRHERCLALAGGLQRLGWTVEEASTFIEPILSVAMDDEVEDRLRTVRDTYDNSLIRETTGWRTLIDRLPPGVGLEVRRRLGGDEEARPDLTDLGNAQRLSKWFGEDVRYCPQTKRWYLWDGRRWERDVPDAVRARYIAILTTDRMLAEELPQIQDADARKAFLKHATASRNVARTRAIITLAETLPELQIRVEELDANPILVNCRNGTLNLDTVSLQPHDREDFLTQLAGCPYIPNSRSDLWDRFIGAVTGGDRDLAAFLQKSAGYSLQGQNPENRFFMLYGPSQTGKSTFLGTLQASFGEYAKNADPTTFTNSKGETGAVREDLVRLRNAHLVVTGEMEEGSRFATAVMKRVTGGDAISARELYSNTIEFTPGFKLWLGTNIKPAVRDSSGGFWRRVVLVPFTNQVSMQERDITLHERLRSPGTMSAVISWCLAGYKLWQQEGLAILPEALEEEVQSYRQDSDILGDFIAEMCVEDPAARVQSSRIYAAYAGWVNSTGGQPISQMAFKTSMAARGFPSARRPSGVIYKGLELRVNAEALVGAVQARQAQREDPYAPRRN